MERNPTTSEIVAGAGMVVWIIFFFTPWYAVDLGIGTARVSGAGAGGIRWLFFLLALAIIAFLVVTLSSFDMTLPAGSGMLVLGGGVIMAVFTVIFAFLWKPGGVIGGVGPSWGVFVSLVGSLITIYGGFAMMNDEEPGSAQRGVSQPQAGWQPQPPPPPAGYGQQPPQPPAAPPQQPQYPQQPPAAPPPPGYEQQPPAAPPPPPEAPPPQAPPPAPPQQPGYPQQPPPPAPPEQPKQ